MMLLNIDHPSCVTIVEKTIQIVVVEHIAFSLFLLQTTVRLELISSGKVFCVVNKNDKKK